jgi:hypothetical protein
MSEQTWESAINPEPPVASEQPEVQAEAAPEAQTETTDTQLVAEESAREGESQPEQVAEEIEPEVFEESVDTPAEIRAMSTASQKEWAQRQFKDAEPVRTYLNYEKPISEFSEDLFQRSESRYRELVYDIVDHGADLATQRLFGIPYEEAKARLTNNAQTDTLIPSDPQATAQPFDDTELNQMDWQVQERLQAYQEAQARKEAELKTQNEALQKRLDALEGKFTTKEQAEQQRITQERHAQAIQKGQELYTNVWSVVEQGIKDSGLEVSKDDPPRIQSLKRAAAKILSTQTEPAFDADEANTKLVGLVMEALNRGEEANAFREEDNLKVRARQAFEKVKASEEVKAILDEIESFANSKRTKREVPAPPVPGAVAGITPKPPTTWDEAISVGAR